MFSISTSNLLSVHPTVCTYASGWLIGDDSRLLLPHPIRYSQPPDTSAPVACGGFDHIVTHVHICLGELRRIKAVGDDVLFGLPEFTTPVCLSTALSASHFGLFYFSLGFVAVRPDKSSNGSLHPHFPQKLTFSLACFSPPLF